MNTDLLNSTKSWLADNRGTFAETMQYLNMANTAAYLTESISEESYSIVLLSGMAGTIAFQLADAALSCAASDAPSISDRDAKKQAEQILQTIKADAAFQEHQDLGLYFEQRFGFPSTEKLRNMGAWEQVKEYASFMAKPAMLPLNFYLNTKQNWYFWSSYSYLRIPRICAGILPFSLQMKSQIDETARDVNTLTGWLKELQDRDPSDNQLLKEIREKLAPVLNRVIVRDSQTGLAFREQFKSHFSEL